MDCLDELKEKSDTLYYRGHKIVLCIFLCRSIIAVLCIPVLIYDVTPGKAIKEVIGIILTLIIYMSLYTGQNWARYMEIVSCVYVALSFLGKLIWDDKLIGEISIPFYIAIIIIHIAIVYCLMVNESVQEYLYIQQTNRSPKMDLKSLPILIITAVLMVGMIMFSTPINEFYIDCIVKVVEVKWDRMSKKTDNDLCQAIFGNDMELVTDEQWESIKYMEIYQPPSYYESKIIIKYSFDNYELVGKDKRKLFSIPVEQDEWLWDYNPFIKKCKNLQYLGIYLEESDLTAIREMPSLEILICGRETTLSKEELDAVASSQVRLLEIPLENKKEIQTVCTNEKLETLVISDYYGTLEGVAEMANVENLRLFNCKILHDTENTTTIENVIVKKIYVENSYIMDEEEYRKLFINLEEFKCK